MVSTGQTGPRPRAFTIIELLVTLTIIVVIASVVLPAIGASREAARRCTCINNMRQIAIALQNYETAFRVLPPGVVDAEGPIRNAPNGMHLGWVVQMLPFMEQNGVARKIDSEVSAYDPVNRVAANARISSLRCPSEPRTGILAGLAATSYAACHHDVEALIDDDNHGVFFRNSRITFADLTDGASTTIFVGEKKIHDTDLGWISGTRSSLRNTGTPINATPAILMPEVVGGFESAHRGGANFTFGDGSVRFVTQTIRPELLRRLGHRNDGELVEEGPY